MNIGSEYAVTGFINALKGDLNDKIEVDIRFEASNRYDAKVTARMKMLEYFAQIGKSEMKIIAFALKLYEVHECAEWTGQLRDDLIAVNAGMYRDVENRRHYKVRTGLPDENWQILLRNAGGDHIVAYVMYEALVGRQTAEAELLSTKGEPHTAIYDLKGRRERNGWVKYLENNQIIRDTDLLL